MKRRFLLLSASLLWMVPPAFAQMVAPQKPAAETPAINADLKAARAANQEKRYADAEALMQKDTAANPGLFYCWIELGTAEIGLKKYADAETSFKIALGSVPAEAKGRSSDGHTLVLLSSAPPPPVVSPFGTNATLVGSRTPDFYGVAYSSLGEIYARTGRVAEAQAAFDAAAKAMPAQAARFRRNETVFFDLGGFADAELDAAQKAIAADPGQAILYYFKGHALVSKATIDPQTQKMLLPPGCGEAFQKYLELDPNGQFASDAVTLLNAAGVPVKGKNRK
jgi:tetratricopeptide (TPR) repeat protein